MDKSKLLNRSIVDALNYRIQQEEIGKAITNLDILKLSSDMLVIDHYIGDKLI